MSRLAFLVAIVLSLLSPSLATAQTTEPVGTVSTDETSVARAYDNPTSFVNTVVGVFAFGAINQTEAEASSMVRTFPTIFVAGMPAEMGEDVVMGELEELPSTLPGDESTVSRVPMTFFGEIEGELLITVVRQGTWVQVLVGMGIGESTVQADVEALARTTQPRWPSEEPIGVRPDGIRTGGIWNMMPMPEDLSEAFEIDPEFEEGPGATTDAPAGLPSVPGATPQAPESPRDVPLLPTPTPATGQAPPAAATEPPTPTVATPAPNPRLAFPYQVTVEIFLSMDSATINEEDGTCGGAGLLDGLAPGGTLTIRETTQGTSSASAPFDTAGVIAYDTETQQEVCYFRATLTGVPARAEYTLLAGDSVLGRYSYEDLSSGEPLLIEIGGQDD